MISSYLVFIGIGPVIGGFCTLLFFRFDKQWKRITNLVFSIGSSAGIGTSAMTYPEIPRNLRAPCLVFLIFSFIVSILVVFFMLASFIQKDDSAYPIRKLDIILGYDKYLEQYYNLRLKQTEAASIKRKEQSLQLQI